MKRGLLWPSKEEWTKIARYFPHALRGKAFANERRKIAGVLFVLKTGCGWRNCPAGYGSRVQLIECFLEWTQFGIWEKLFAECNFKLGQSSDELSNLLPRGAKKVVFSGTNRETITASNDGVRPRLHCLTEQTLPSSASAQWADAEPRRRKRRSSRTLAETEVSNRLVLSDASWARMASHIIGDGRGRGAAGRDNRMFVEGVLWIARTGAPWRDLPEIFGEWNSVFRRFCRWSKKGVWPPLFEAMADDPDFEYFLINDVIVYVSRPAPGLRRRVLQTGLSAASSAL